MFKFFKRLIWRLKHRNIKLSEVRSMVEAQKFFENYPRTSCPEMQIRDKE